MNNQNILYLFFINAVLNIIAVYTQSEVLNYITKPLLMVLLAWYFYASAPQSTFSKFILLGIIFSIGGDIAMMFQGEPMYFILGLSSFLIAHILYVVGMYRYPNFKLGLLFKQFWLVFPLIAYGLVLVVALWSGLGEMKLPVAVYSSVIMLMGLSALNMFSRVQHATARWLLVGALLFILSDSVIAINKFGIDGLSIPFPSLVIMVTYITGQFFIAKGAIASAIEAKKIDS